MRSKILAVTTMILLAAYAGWSYTGTAAADAEKAGGAACKAEACKCGADCECGTDCTCAEGACKCPAACKAEACKCGAECTCGTDCTCTEDACKCPTAESNAACGKEGKGCCMKQAA